MALHNLRHKKDEFHKKKQTTTHKLKTLKQKSKKSNLIDNHKNKSNNKRIEQNFIVAPISDINHFINHVKNQTIKCMTKIHQILKVA